MNILEVGDIIKERIGDFLAENNVKGIEVVLEIPSRIEYGELATAVSFKIAKILNRRSLDVANDLRDYLLEDLPYYINDVRVAGKGYINIYLDRNTFYKEYFKEVLEKGLEPYKKRFGGRYYRIEYTSVNPNKALHIGHARNVILGSSLSSFLRELGNKVHEINYIDDTGSQVADLVIGFLELGYDVKPKDDIRFDKYCGDVVYVDSVKKIEESKELLDKRREIIKAIEEGDNPVASFAKIIATKVLNEQLRTCWRLGARYDLLVWESDIIWSGMHKKLNEIIEKSSIIRKVDSGKYRGTVVIKISEGDDIDPYKDEVLIRSDGTLTYVGKDLIFALWKLGLLDHYLKIKRFIEQPDGSVLYSTFTDGDGDDYKPDECDKLFNVIGVEQSKPQSAIKEVIRSLYGDEYADKYIHYSYELVSLSKRSVENYFKITVDSERVKMSGRRGIYFNVDDVIDKMIENVLEHMKENGITVSDEKARVIAEKVSISSLKYSLLSLDRDKVVNFDIDRSLDVSRESGAYILYSYVRARSILDKAEYIPKDIDIDFTSLNENDYIISRLMSLFPIVLNESIKKYEVKPIVNYMYRLASSFNEYYEKNPVLKAPEPIRKYRLIIISVYRKIMELMGRLTNIELVDIM